MERLNTFEAFVAEAGHALLTQREHLVEEFLISGAMPRDLRMEIGPIECDTSLRHGDDHLWSVWQDVRMV